MHDFSVWQRTDSNPADITRFHHAEKKLTHVGFYVGSFASETFGHGPENKI